MTRFLIAFATFLVSISAHAHPNQANGLVTSLQTFGSNTYPIYVYMDVDFSGLNCTPASGGTAITLPTDQPNFRTVYATLLTALVAQRPVIARINEGTVDCQISYVTIR